MDFGTVRAFCLTVAAAIALSGCAYIVEDGSGVRRVIGFVDMEVEAPPPNTPVAGKFLSVRSVGVTVTDAADSSGLVVGYSDQSFATLRDGTLVDGHPLRPMERTEGVYNTLKKP